MSSGSHVEHDIASLLYVLSKKNLLQPGTIVVIDSTPDIEDSLSMVGTPSLHLLGSSVQCTLRESAVLTSWEFRTPR